MRLCEDDVRSIALGRVLVHLRERASLNQAEAAARACTTGGTVSRMERGLSVPGAFLLQRYIAAVGCSMDTVQRHVDQGLHKAESLCAPWPVTRDAWWTGLLDAGGVVAVTAVVTLAVAVVMADSYPKNIPRSRSAVVRSPAP